MPLKTLFLVLFLSALPGISPTLYAQDKLLHKADSSLQGFSQLPNQYFNKINRKTGKLQNRLSRSSQKALRKFKKQQQKIYGKLVKVDSLAAHNFLTQNMGKLETLQDRLSGKADAVTSKLDKVSKLSGGYFPYLDTLKNALGFLRGKGRHYTGYMKDMQQKLDGSMDQVQSVEDRLDQVDQLQQTLQQQQQQLTEQLKQYDFLQKDLLKLNKTAYYYAARVKNYKELFSDPKKMEAEALKQLRKLPAFNNFMKEHSALAGLFSLPAGYGSGTPDLAGLQTRSMVEQEIQQRIAGGGPNAQQQISQQMQAARDKLQQLKDKLPGGFGKLTTSGSTAEMPNFKPNELKSKTFFQRLDFGGNVQFAKSSTYYPTTSDIAGQVAYKVTEKGSIGLGAAYKLGMGKDIQHIAFSSQGVGLRSFVDYKLKYGLYLNGGFEQNYNTGFENLRALQHADLWTGSALMGISKKYKVSDKLKGNVILLYDFLHNQHYPQTEAFKFRIGYEF